jgi:hypothetical protein
MAAPDKLAFDPHDLIVVHRGGNRQSPVIRETVELAGEIDGLEQDGFLYQRSRFAATLSRIS